VANASRTQLKRPPRETPSVARGVPVAQVTALALVPLLVVHGAQGQPTSTVEPIEEIIVAAQRIEQKIQDVPMSVSAFSGQDLELRSIQRVADLIARLPNVQITGDSFRGATGGQFTIRGIPDVLIYVDGVNAFRSFGSVARQMIEVERVEVIRGPQGTLFGRDATGGAIQYITKLPAPEFGARVSATLGDYARKDLMAAVDWPVSETVNTKWTAAYSERDGFVDSLRIDRSFGDFEDQVLRGDLLWTPTDAFQLRFNVENNEYRANGQPRVTSSVYEPQQGFTPVRAYQLAGVPFSNSLYAAGYPGGEIGERQSKAAYWNDGWRLDEERVVLDMEWRLTDSLTLKSISGDFDIVNDSSIDHCSCELNILFQRNIDDGHLYSQELQLRGEHGRVRWLGGLYYSGVSGLDHESVWVLQDFRDNPALLQRFYEVVPVTLPGFPPNNYESGSKFRGSESALFGQVTVRLVDRAFLTLGVRRSESDRETEVLSVSPTLSTVIGGDPVGSIEPYTVLSNKPYDFGRTTPRVSFEYVWNDDLRTYLSYAEGFNSGGVNTPGVPALPTVIPYDPEVIKTTELGLRSDWLAGRLRLNVTMFSTDWADKQVTVFLPDVNTGTFIPVGVIVNAAAAKAEGLEVELVAAVAEHWRVDLGLGALDARYTEVGAARDIRIDTPFAQAPERSYSVGVQRDFAFVRGASLVARLDYGWVDDHVMMPQRLFQTTQPGYGLLSARVSYDLPGQRYQLTLFGNNLTDEYYFDSAVTDPFIGYATATLGRPREIGFSFRASFE